MEQLIKWNEQLNIGVEVIDKAHANLFRIVGKLTRLVNNETNYKNACKEGLKYLEDYTMKHFSEEEAYMRTVHYRGYEKHKQIHDTFRDQTLVALKKTLESSNYSQIAAQRFLGTLLGWLTGHIMTEDQEITGELPSAKIYDYTFKTSTIATAISQSIQNVFRIEAALIDDHYSGWNIGQALYFRLCYNLSDGGKIQLLLSVEERLARRGVGLLFGLSAMQDNTIIQEASLQIFRQFFHYMSELFNTDITYQLDRQEMLAADEFRSDFMTRYPCCLLFGTRLGHLVFCSRKWKAKRRKIQ